MCAKLSSTTPVELPEIDNLNIFLFLFLFFSIIFRFFATRSSVVVSLLSLLLLLRFFVVASPLLFLLRICCCHLDFVFVVLLEKMFRTCRLRSPFVAT